MQLRSCAMAAVAIACAGVLSAPAHAVAPAGTAGPATEAELRAELGNSFGGAWLDQPDQGLVVAVTDAAAADRARALGARPKLVARGEAELTAAKTKLDSTPAPPSVFAWGVDIKTSQVFVRADPAALPEAAAFVKASGVDPAVVRIEASTERPTLAGLDAAAPTALEGPAALDLRGGDGWGDATRNNCTTGFTVERLLEPNRRGFITTGSCGTAGQAAMISIGGRQVPLGVIRESHLGNHSRAWVESNSDWLPRPLVNGYSAGLIRMSGWREVPVGAGVCRHGMITSSCGTILTKGFTVIFPEGQRVIGVTETNACAQSGGDRGGPFLSGTQAQGVLIGMSTDSNCLTYFSPIVRILSAFRLKLLTDGSATTPPSVVDVLCERTGDGTTFQCLAVPYHPNGVQIRWKLNGTAKPAWNDQTLVFGSCPNPNGRANFEVTVSNSSGSDTRTASLLCGPPPD